MIVWVCVGGGGWWDGCVWCDWIVFDVVGNVVGVVVEGIGIVIIICVVFEGVVVGVDVMVVVGGDDLCLILWWGFFFDNVVKKVMDFGEEFFNDVGNIGLVFVLLKNCFWGWEEYWRNVRVVDCFYIMYVSI